MSDEPPVKLSSIAPEKGGFQSLRRELGITSFGINAISFRPGQRGRVHRHERQEEAYLVISGELTVLTGDDEHVLGPGDLASVAPETRRQLVNAGSDPVVFVALGGYGEHAGRDGIAWTDWDEAGDGRPPQEVEMPADLPR
jgi:uncharacterized cupin superfamily protein